MQIWHHSFATHIRHGQRELILINRWWEARQIGIGYCNDLRFGRVRWLFLNKWKFGGWWSW